MARPTGPPPRRDLRWPAPRLWRSLFAPDQRATQRSCVHRLHIDVCAEPAAIAVAPVTSDMPRPPRTAASRQSAPCPPSTPCRPRRAARATNASSPHCRTGRHSVVIVVHRDHAALDEPLDRDEAPANGDLGSSWPSTASVLSLAPATSSASSTSSNAAVCSLAANCAAVTPLLSTCSTLQNGSTKRTVSALPEDAARCSSVPPPFVSA
jgi:hypothetical protein